MRGPHRLGFAGARVAPRRDVQRARGRRRLGPTEWRRRRRRRPRRRRAVPPGVLAIRRRRPRRAGGRAHRGDLAHLRARLGAPRDRRHRAGELAAADGAALRRARAVPRLGARPAAERDALPRRGERRGARRVVHRHRHPPPDPPRGGPRAHPPPPRPRPAAPRAPHARDALGAARGARAARRAPLARLARPVPRARGGPRRARRPRRGRPLGGRPQRLGVPRPPRAPRLAPRGPGATWPAWHPHSQLDHLFVRGPVDVVDGGAVAALASDHRPMAASIVVRPLR